MRNFSLVSFCGLLLVVAACGSDSSDPGGGEIRSQDDVRRLFEAVVPDLVEAFTELANQQFAAASALSTSTNKAEGDSSVPCPGGGTLVVNVITGQATLTDCVAGGVTISASLTLSVLPILPSSYQAFFWGTLTVSGSFNGTVEVDDAYMEWTTPATVANTLWQVTVTVNGKCSRLREVAREATRSPDAATSVLVQDPLAFRGVVPAIRIPTVRRVPAEIRSATRRRVAPADTPVAAAATAMSASVSTPDPSMIQTPRRNASRAWTLPNAPA